LVVVVLEAKPETEHRVLILFSAVLHQLVVGMEPLMETMVVVVVLVVVVELPLILGCNIVVAQELAHLFRATMVDLAKQTSTMDFGLLAVAVLVLVKQDMHQGVTTVVKVGPVYQIASLPQP
jgi:hypothetical protein